MQQASSPGEEIYQELADKRTKGKILLQKAQQVERDAEVGTKYSSP